MRIFIARHGEREDMELYNSYLRHQDPPISERGNRQAKSLADYFRPIPLNRIIASEYVRTRQTAQYVAEDKMLPINRDARLNEIDNGVIERMSLEEIRSAYPEFWNDFQSGEKDVRFPEGETGEEVKARQKSLLAELIERQEDVLLVSHEGYIRLLMCHLLDMPVYKRGLFKIDLCGLSEFEFDGKSGTWRIARINQILPVSSKAAFA